MRSPETLYCDHMEEIKKRLEIVDSVVDSKVTTGNESKDAEIICLQIRKVLEMIAFASIISNEEKYSEAYSNISTHWRIGDILKKLEAINPKYYPTPVKYGKSKNEGVIHFDLVEEGYLTVDDLIKLYDKCSKILHTWNPYRTEPRIVDFGLSIQEWVNRIRRLLDIHYMKAVESDSIRVVIMNDPNDGKVHMITGK